MLSTKDGDPLLAFWPVGLGRAAVFLGCERSLGLRLGDVARVWAVLLVGGARARASASRADVVDGDAGGRAWHHAIDGPVDRGARRRRQAARLSLTPRVRVQSGTKPPIEIPARQTAPGHYEARAIVDAAELFAANVLASDGIVESGLTSALVAPDTNEEYRFRAVDESRLRSIASATGGQWQPSAAQIANTAGEHRATRRPMWPTLLWIALGLWLTDLLLRRVRVFERV